MRGVRVGAGGTGETKRTTLASGVLARDVRAVFVIPFLQALVAVSAFLSSMVAADRMFHVYIALYWRTLSRKKPIDKWAGRAAGGLLLNNEKK